MTRPKARATVFLAFWIAVWLLNVVTLYHSLWAHRVGSAILATIVVIFIGLVARIDYLNWRDTE